jgi:hypothetical protein
MPRSTTGLPSTGCDKMLAIQQFKLVRSCKGKEASKFLATFKRMNAIRTTFSADKETFMLAKISSERLVEGRVTLISHIGDSKFESIVEWRRFIVNVLYESAWKKKSAFDSRLFLGKGTNKSRIETLHLQDLLP